MLRNRRVCKLIHVADCRISYPRPSTPAIDHITCLVHLLSLDPGPHVQACSFASEVRIPVLRAQVLLLLHAGANITTVLHTVGLLHAVEQGLGDVFAAL
jgi:hypothetical protein